MKKDYSERLNMICNSEIKREAKAFFNRFWLDLDEYHYIWLPVKNRIFRSTASHYPHMMFQDGYDLWPQIGGLLLADDEHPQLMACAREIGDRFLLIVENQPHPNPPRTKPPYRLKIPVDTPWSEFMSGGYISRDIFLAPVREYYVFGDSGQWGEYVSNDHIDMVRVFGFLPEFAEMFQSRFPLSPEEEDQLMKEMPPEYIARWRKQRK